MVVCINPCCNHQQTVHQNLLLLTQANDDVAEPSPPKFIEAATTESDEKTIILNSAYMSWPQADQLLLSWLFSTLSSASMGQVTECPTSFAAWSTLERLYSQKSMNTRKGSMSISEYILKIKNLGEGLRVVGQTVTEFDLILSIMSGLGHEYDPVVILASSQHQSMSLEDAQYMLMVHEQRLEQLSSVSSIDTSGASANFASNTIHAGYNRRGSNNRGNGQNRGGCGRGSKWSNTNCLSCQLCNKTGHGALQCYKRFDQTWTGTPSPHTQSLPQLMHGRLYQPLLQSSTDNAPKLTPIDSVGVVGLSLTNPTTVHPAV
ncbi:hypothetical protein ACOSP7_015029 [Xanthoceras sorbifolium]